MFITNKIISVLISLFLVYSFFSHAYAQSTQKELTQETIIQEEFIKEEELKEQVIQEEPIQEEFIQEETLKEQVIQEEIDLIENDLPNDMMLDEFSVNIVSREQLEYLLNDIYINSNYDYNIDLKKVISNFAVGSSVIVITGVATNIAAVTTSPLSPVSFIAIQSFKGSIKGAVIGAVTGATIGAFIGAVNSNGNIKAIKKCAIEGAAEGYMWGAITGAVTGGVQGYKGYNNIGFSILKAEKAGIKIGTTGKILNNIKIKKGIKYIYDINNKEIGYIDKKGFIKSYLLKTKINNGLLYKDLVTGRNLKTVSNNGKYIPKKPSRVVGQVDDNNNFIFDWAEKLGKERQEAVSKAWKMEKELVESTGKGTRDWTDEEIVELLETGHIKGYQGHHINSVVANPEMAGDPNNIVFLCARTGNNEHLLVHGKNYGNFTYGKTRK